MGQSVGTVAGVVLHTSTVVVAWALTKTKVVVSTTFESTQLAGADRLVSVLRGLTGPCPKQSLGVTVTALQPWQSKVEVDVKVNGCSYTVMVSVGPPGITHELVVKVQVLGTSWAEILSSDEGLVLRMTLCDWVHGLTKLQRKQLCLPQWWKIAY